MILDIARFELRYQFKQPLIYLIGLVFFLLAFGSMTSPNVQIGGGGAVHANAPVAIAFSVLILSLFGLFISAAFAGHAMVRDKNAGAEGYVYATPVKAHELVIGRFIGAYVMALLAFAGVPAGLALGSLMPWLDPETLGPFHFGHYLNAFAAFAAPTILITSAIFAAVAAFTRSIMGVWVSAIGLLIFYFIGQSVANNLDLRELTAILDPFGITAASGEIRNWTVAEQNARMIPFEGALLWNRALWIAISVALIGVTAALLRLRGEVAKGGEKAKRASLRAKTKESDFASSPGPSPTPSFGAATTIRQFAARMGLEARTMTRSVAFWLILAFGAFQMLFLAFNQNLTYGTPTYAVTRAMVLLAESAFAISPLLIGIFFAAELAWRDRQHKMAEVIDATPAPSWAFVFPKIASIVLMLLALMAGAGLTGVLFQLMHGYGDIEWGVYVRRAIAFSGLSFALIAVLSFFVQALVGHKWFGLLVMMLYVVVDITLTSMGFEHPLYNYGSRPEAPLSDLNGGGHFEEAAKWFDLYWAAIAGILATLSYLLWSRGTVETIGRRLAMVPRRAGPGALGAIAVFAIVALGAGGFIFYNVNILNDYVTGEDREKRAVLYEERFASLEGMTLPKITDVAVTADIYPSERRYVVKGTNRIENKSGEPIAVVHVGFGDQAIVDSLSLDGLGFSEKDADFNHFVFRLDDPMAPGEAAVLAFEVRVENPGFRHRGNNVSDVVENGTFFNNFGISPRLGYNSGRILTDPALRRKYDLEPVRRMAKLEDESAWDKGFLRPDADWVSFKAVVSTEGDQIALAPGYLKRRWEADGRNHFEYEMDAPIQNFWAILSGRYAVAKDAWGNVALEVYHHPSHAMNVKDMMAAMKKSFDYFSDAFSPYQYRQMRIIEFPAYASFAQAFPNTVPYSEAIGFIADVRDPEDVNYVFYVTAHEMAHQWWAHQLSSADVQGGTMLIETFAQYSALMVMKREYGDRLVRKFLDYERDSYLRARGSEIIEELPLYRVENQPYIHYRKGAVVMYALQDYVGEEVVNRALARLLKEKALAYDPYPRTVDFLRILREEAGPEHDGLITDLFEKITLYDLELDEATVAENAQGGFDVELTVQAKKLHADGEGEETEADLDLPIDVGAFTKRPDRAKADENPEIFLEKRRVVSGENVIRFTVAERPAYVAIDPYAKLLDRDDDDNGAAPSLVQGESARVSPMEAPAR